MRQMRKFLQNDSGATAIMFGLSIIPVFGLAGAALDFSRASSARQSLQNAVDSVALQAVIDQSNGKRNDFRRSFDGVYTSNIAVDGLTLEGQWVGDRFQVTARGAVRTTISAIVAPTIPVAVTATAARSTPARRPNEFVFAFDTTASMAINGCFNCAVETLTGSLETLRRNSQPGSFSAAFIPFSDRVNVGTAKSAWLGTQVAGWNGCMEPREEMVGGNRHALTDRSPRDLSFKPSAKGHLISELGPRNAGGLPVCPSQVAVAPTSDLNAFESAIRSMRPQGTGRYDEALAWAWRMTSPTWRGQWGNASLPAAYGEGDKTLVILTDGFTEAYRYEVGGEAGGVFGYNRGSRQGFEAFASLCSTIRAKGIKIHVIFTQTGNDRFESYGRDCAGSPENFHKVGDASGLQSIFKDITSTQSVARLVD